VPGYGGSSRSAFRVAPAQVGNLENQCDETGGRPATVSGRNGGRSVAGL